MIATFFETFIGHGRVLTILQALGHFSLKGTLCSLPDDGSNLVTVVGPLLTEAHYDFWAVAPTLTLLLRPLECFVKSSSITMSYIN